MARPHCWRHRAYRRSCAGCLEAEAAALQAKLCEAQEAGRVLSGKLLEAVVCGEQFKAELAAAIAQNKRIMTWVCQFLPLREAVAYEQGRQAGLDAGERIMNDIFARLKEGPR